MTTTTTTTTNFKTWILTKELGKGAQGSVWYGCCQEQKSVAVKISKRSQDSVREFELMSQLTHPFVVPVVDGQVTDNQVTMVMEMADQTLLDVLQEQPNGIMSESMARNYFMQLLSATAYLHNVEHVVHKDIKLENVLVQRDADRCMLADFGFARRFVPGKQSLQDHCASMHYAAPEIWHGKHYEGPSVDIWALGVTLYALTTGYLPFGGEDMASAYYQVEALHTRALWLPNDMSSELKHLIRRCLLVYDMDKRATLAEIRAHPWITRGFSLPLHLLVRSHESFDVGVLRQSQSDESLASSLSQCVVDLHRVNTAESFFTTKRQHHRHRRRRKQKDK